MHESTAMPYRPQNLSLPRCGRSTARFAGALLDIGLPKGDVPLALLAFNLGVEAGQLLFIALILVAAMMLRRLTPQVLTASMRSRGPALTGIAYAIGGVSAYWFVDRIAAF